MVNDFLQYDPGILPSAPPPLPGETILIRINGFPPYKDNHFSIRNVRHKFHSRFVALRQAATEAMAGRAPFPKAVCLDFLMHNRELEKNKSLNDYLGGIIDTLDGSHGVEFTYLPIVFKDDCQVVKSKSLFKYNVKEFYEIKIRFLPKTMEDLQVTF